MAARRARRPATTSRAEARVRTSAGARAGSVLVLVATLLVAGLDVPLAAAAEPTVRVVHSLELVRPADLPTSFGTSSTAASLRAVRNEFESFQVVVHGGDAGVAGVSVAVDGDLTGPGGSIAATNVRPYAERYYTVTTPSDRELFHAGDVVPGQDGQVRCPAGALHCQFPDALVPERDVFFDEDRNAFPLDVPAGQNRVAWVDVLVPQGTAVGTYSGSLSVTGAGLDVTVPLTVEVLDLGGQPMPSTPTLRGGVQISTGAFCPAHDACAGITGGGQALYDRYLIASLENRFPLTRPMMALPDSESAWTTYGAKAVQGTTTARLPGARVTDVLFTGYGAPWDYDAGFADEWKQRQASVGRTDLVSYYCDEMGDSGTKWDTICEPGYDVAAAAWAGSAVEPDPGSLSVVHTGRDASLAYGRSRPAHDAADNVDALVLVANRQENPYCATAPAWCFSPRAEYDPPTGFLGEAVDHQLWFYTSCESAGCALPADTTTVQAAVDPYVGTPGLIIDQPPSQVRSLGWHDFTYDVTGDFYYQAVGSLSTAWDACTYPPTSCQFVEGANGDGNLFYPGTPTQIGGTTHIPVESIRLKRTRDGREDYEILHWLSTNGHDAEARAVATTLFPNVHSSTATAAEVAAARDDLLDLLVPAATAPGAPAAPTATAGVGSLTATWLPPGDDGGSPVTRYDLQVADSAGGSIVATGDVTSPHVVTGLPAGEGRKVRVRARNAVGIGPWSAWSSVVVPTGPPSGDPLVLAFTQGVGADADIHLTDLAGTSEAQLTGTGGAATGAGVFDGFPDWSPDGARIAFTRGSGTAADLWVMDADGTDQARLTGAGLPAGGDGVSDAKPAWSPDGELLAFVRGSGAAAEIWVVTADGATARQVTANAVEDFDPAWSPEGARLVFGSRRSGPEGDLVVIGVDGRQEQVVSGGWPWSDAGDEDLPDWWRGDDVAADLVDGGDYDIVVGALGAPTLATNITASSTAHDFAPTWSPDGTRIAFLSDRASDGDPGGDADLFVMDRDGSDVVRIGGDSVAQADVDWRPQVPGATFAVTSTADGVDVAPGDGTCATSGGTCTLRAAVMEANASVAADTVVVPAGTYGRTRTGASPPGDLATTGSLEVTAPLVVQGAGAATTVVDANGAEAVFEVVGPGTTLVVDDLAVREGGGAGIAAGPATRAVLRDCSVRATTSGGALVLPGSGVYGDDSSALVVRRCTVEGSAGAALGVWQATFLVDQATLASSAVGASVWGTGHAPPAQGLIVTSTLSGNGQGLVLEGDVRMTSSTLVGSAEPFPAPLGDLVLESSVVDSTGTADDCPPTSAGRNVLAVADGCTLGTGDQAGTTVTPLATGLGALAANGGPTATHLPSSTSPVVDAGDPAGCPGLLPGAAATDQRGQSRPVDGDGVGGVRCDIGAVERPVPAATVPDVPVGVGAVAAWSSVGVSWSAPGSDGGSAVVGYDVELVAGGVPVAGSQVSVGDVRSVSVPASGCLPVGVRVRARNGVGAGSWSAVSSVVLPWSVDGFVDVAPGRDFYGDIVWMAHSCLSTGWPDGTYRPGESITRQAMAAFLWRLAGSPPSGLVSPFFADVGPGHQFFEAIQWMGASGVSTGTPRPGGRPSFAPDEEVTRQAMAAFLHRFDGDAPPPVVEHVFADVPPGAFFYDDIQWMGLEGISTGTPQVGGKPRYAPNEPVTRQAMAAFIHRMVDR